MQTGSDDATDADSDDQKQATTVRDYVEEARDESARYDTGSFLKRELKV